MTPVIQTIAVGHGTHDGTSNRNGSSTTKCAAPANTISVASAHRATAFTGDLTRSDRARVA